MLGVFRVLFGTERRRYYRYPCKIRAHFSFIFRSVAIRGEGEITDITAHGICCDNVRFFHSEPDFKLKLNRTIMVYFSLPKEYHSVRNMEVKGKIRSVLHKGEFGYIKRFGILFTYISGKQRKALKAFIKDLERERKSSGK